jgi:hypothetical protein
LGDPLSAAQETIRNSPTAVFSSATGRFSFSAQRRRDNGGGFGFGVKPLSVGSGRDTRLTADVVKEQYINFKKNETHYNIPEEYVGMERPGAQVNLQQRHRDRAKYRRECSPTTADDRGGNCTTKQKKRPQRHIGRQYGSERHRPGKDNDVTSLFRAT